MSSLCPYADAGLRPYAEAGLRPYAEAGLRPYGEPGDLSIIIIVLQREGWFNVSRDPERR